jgi:putative FmdB family regulatory protein
MPIYEYSCQACGDRFDVLVRDASARVTCPSCESQDLERLLSIPGVRSATTRELAMKAAKRRDRVQARDRMHDRLQYEKSHDRHG